MSGGSVGIIRLGDSLLVFTTPLPPGSIGELRFDAGTDIWEGDGYFVVSDHWMDYRSANPRARQAAITTHVWYALHRYAVVPDSEPPAAIDGDPRRMLEAPAA